MAIVNRQNNLFAAEDWTVAYKAYSQVNFQAYDFDSIRTALVDYVRINYPENFNDYVESSEFIAIIEMLAYLSQSLAFRMDINSRENFLETAERRDSVFKLARMLGYNPKRNIPASGIMKVVRVRTTESIRDSQGNDLNNINISWDDANNPLSYEQFITVLNAAMSSANRFTAPVKEGIVGNIPTELYQLNTPITAPVAYNFNLTAEGVNRPFNIINSDFVDNGFFFERHPDPTNLFNIIYRNDSLGLSSSNTGFFVMFKQGSLQFLDLDYTTPLQSREEIVAVSNINELDVYLQEINSAGLILNKWEKVPNTVGQTLNYNNVAKNTKNLYAVENVDNGGIKLKFADGNFGNIPYGIFRLWYRSSDPNRYIIQPENARNISITVPYVDKQNKNQALTLTFRLEYRVNNSLPAESLAAIKRRAPQVYYTQNRMVSAQDYNVFPLSQSNNILKLKAMNKTHAGHSRYIDINDPTGTYQNLDTFAKDAILYSEESNRSQSVVINDNTTPREVVVSILPEILKTQQLNNFVYYGMRNTWTQFQENKFIVSNLNIRWEPLPAEAISNTGYMTETFSQGNQVVMLNINDSTKMFKENSLIKFVNSSDLSDYKWVRIISIENNGALASGLVTSIGPWTLSEEVGRGYLATEVIVSLRKLFTVAEADSIQTEINNRRTFALGYDLYADSWYIIQNKDLDRTSSFNVSHAKDTSGAGLDSSWIVLMEYYPVNIFSYRYNVTARGQNYVVQSKNDLKFYNIKNVKVLDNNNKSSKDTITFTTINAKPFNSDTFEWHKVGNNDYRWRNTTTGTTYIPRTYSPGIVLKTRDTKWFDVNVYWKSNFGLMKPKGNVLNTVDTATGNQYVSEATVLLAALFDRGELESQTTFVTIANNSGQINKIPSTITIPFNSTTFGGDIIDPATGNITYRLFNDSGNSLLVFSGNANCYSYGTTGTSNVDTSVSGRLFLANANVTAQTGNLIYSGLHLNQYHNSFDRTSAVSKDKIIVDYIQNKERLDQEIVWEVTDVYRYNDGYTDPRKVIVAPIDSDSDLVPDRPLQFKEYVYDKNIQVFEYYTDFDGYNYDRPTQGVIADFRNENIIRFDISSNLISSESYAKAYDVSILNWLFAKDLATASIVENDQGKAAGLKIYAVAENKVYLNTSDSTRFVNGDASNVRLVETNDFFVRVGRGPTQDTSQPQQQDSVIRWQHVAPKDVRIDPSISNVVEMIVLTNSYYTEVKSYLREPTGSNFPVEPTSSELAIEFENLNEYKSASDTIVFRSAKFKLLFGPFAEQQYQTKFRVVKLSNNISDNELKSQIISAINNYFEVENWEFGETFYFTELSSYIHQRLGSAIGSIVILPRNTSGSFGDMFSVKAEPNELFASTATVADIEIVERITSQTLRADR
jgi:hypothetical protein